MKYYNIKVNGKNYQVEVEELQGDPTHATAPKRKSKELPWFTTTNEEAKDTQSSADTTDTQAESAEATAVVSEGATAVRAPMPGTILDVKVEQGQVITANTVLCILEAMKMENEIIFPKAGTVVQVAVSSGKTVNAGDLLFSIQE